MLKFGHNMSANEGFLYMPSLGAFGLVTGNLPAKNRQKWIKLNQYISVSSLPVLTKKFVVFGRTISAVASKVHEHPKNVFFSPIFLKSWINVLLKSPMFSPNFRLFWRKSGVPRRNGVEFFCWSRVDLDSKNRISVSSRQSILDSNKREDNCKLFVK